MAVGALATDLGHLPLFDYARRQAAGQSSMPRVSPVYRPVRYRIYPMTSDNARYWEEIDAARCAVRNRCRALRKARARLYAACSQPADEQTELLQDAEFTRKLAFLRQHLELLCASASGRKYAEQLLAVLNWFEGHRTAPVPRMPSNKRLDSWVALCADFTVFYDCIMPWLKQYPYGAVRSVLKDMATTYKNAYDDSQPNARLPKYHDPAEDGKRHKGFTLLDGAKVEDGWVYVPGTRDQKGTWHLFRRRGDNKFESYPIGPVRVWQERQRGRRRARWFITLWYKVPCNVLYADVADTGLRGLDRNSAEGETAAPYVDSTGHVWSVPNTERLEERKKRLQRKAAKQEGKNRKTKAAGSRNWHKTQAKIRCIDAKIAAVWHHALQEMTTEMKRNARYWGIENLNLLGMTTSGKGSVEEPGKNVKAIAAKNRGMRAARLGKAQDMLEYKLPAGHLIGVHAAYTSQQCSDCGYTDKKNRLSRAVFRCGSCGLELHADWNAARNIAQRALEQLKAGDVSADDPRHKEIAKLAVALLEPSMLEARVTASLGGDGVVQSNSGWADTGEALNQV